MYGRFAKVGNSSIKKILSFGLWSRQQALLSLLLSLGSRRRRRRRRRRRHGHCRDGQAVQHDWYPIVLLMPFLVCFQGASGGVC